MTPDFRAQQAITDLRRVAAHVVSLCDAAIYSQEGEASRAMRELPARVRVLIFRSGRVLSALESEGIS